MISILTGLTPDSLTEATTAIRAVLQQQDPTLDLSTGGPVDSILVAGNAAVVADTSRSINSIYLRQQLRGIAAGTVQVSDADLDGLASAYFVTRQVSRPAFGLLSIVVSADTQYRIGAGFRFVRDGIYWATTATYTVYPVGTTGVQFTDPTNLQLEQVYDPDTGFGYRFSLPVTCETDDAAGVLVVGDRVTPTTTFSYFGAATAATNFQGGTASETNQQLAGRIMSGMVVRSAGAGEASLDRLVKDAYPLADSAGIGTGDPLMQRDRQNLFGVPTGGKLDLYCRSGAMSLYGAVVDAVVTNHLTRTVQITLTRDQSAGVYRVRVLPNYTAAPPSSLTGDVTVTAVEHLPWVTSGFNPSVTADDLAFSTRQQIRLTVTDTRLDGVVPIVPMVANGDLIVGRYRIEATYQAGCLEIDRYITSPTVRPPALDILVRAAVPCRTSVGVSAVRPVNYTGPGPDVLAARLSSLVNRLQIGIGTLDPQLLRSMVATLAPQLVVLSVSLNGTVLAPDGTDVAIAQTGSGLTIPSSLLQGFGPANTYFVTTPATVQVTLA